MLVLDLSFQVEIEVTSFKSMALLNLFIASLMPVLKVLLLTALGALLATERVDILGLEARKHLNNLVFFVFDPSLVSSSLAKSVTFKNLVMLWFMPLNILATFLLGSILGWIVIKITRTPRQLRGIVVGSCAAGNLGNLPLIIVPAVCKERGGPFGDPELCQEHGLAYVSLSMAFTAVYMWTYVYNLVRMYALDIGEVPKQSSCSVPGGETFENHPKSCGADQFQVDCSSFDARKEEDKPNWINVSLSKVLQIVGSKIKWKRLFAPSTIGAIVGFTIGIVPPFRKALIGNTAPLRVVEDSIYLIGVACIATPTMIVGANLLQGLKGSRVRTSVIIGIVVARYIILPIIGVVTVKFAVRFRLIQPDPLYQFVLMLQYAVPPAISIGTMTQLFGAGESEYSVIMLSTYALATASITLWSMFFMWVV